MLKKLIESISGQLSPSELRAILDLATTDIKINRIDYGQRTSLHEAVGIAAICHSVLQK